MYKASCFVLAGKDQIERLLALGASRWEATADLVGRSIKLAMTPLLNTMSVVGLVSIPGVWCAEQGAAALSIATVV
jgi:putative ABC transport system permease protein